MNCGLERERKEKKKERNLVKLKELGGIATGEAVDKVNQT
jgi:hypothetical protein